MRIGFTLNEAELEIWPIDDWSRKKVYLILGKNQIGYEYMPTTMGTVSLRFRTFEDYKKALELIKNDAQNFN